MLPPQSQRLEYDDLAGKVRHRQHMREQAELVQRGVMDPIGAVDADHAGQDRIHAKDAGCEWRHLVGWRRGGFVLFGGGRRGDELRDGVWRGGGGVGDEQSVVDAASVVQGGKVLDRVAYGSKRDLGRWKSA